MREYFHVTFAEVLAVLLGWVGRRVSVGVATSAEPPIMLAHLAGRVHAGAELSPDESEGAVYFHMQDAGTGFILARQHYNGAGWSKHDRSCLVVRLGAVNLWIELDEDN